MSKIIILPTRTLSSHSNWITLYPSQRHSWWRDALLIGSMGIVYLSLINIRFALMNIMKTRRAKVERRKWCTPILWPKRKKKVALYRVFTYIFSRNFRVLHVYRILALKSRYMAQFFTLHCAPSDECPKNCQSRTTRQFTFSRSSLNIETSYTNYTNYIKKHRCSSSPSSEQKVHHACAQHREQHRARRVLHSNHRRHLASRILRPAIPHLCQHKARDRCR